MHDRVSFARRNSLLLGLLLAVVCLTCWPLQAEDFDWRNVNGQNWLTPVRDQFGGTCWDFAACGVVEGKYMLTRNDITYQPDISEQQVNWETSPDMGDSINGGNTYKVMNYLVSHGIVLDSECPYQPTSPDTGISPYWPLGTGWQDRVFKATAVDNTISQGTDANHVKWALKNYGPLAIHLEADNDWYSPPPGVDRGGHMVVLVGYHDNLPGETAPGGGYWIIKNSWGSGWNGNGYGAIAYATRPGYSDWSWLGIYNREVNGISSPVFFTGSMATVTWKGGAANWFSGGNNWTGSDMYGNSIPTYAWENKETSATFNAPGASVNLSGTVIAHGVTISAGATGYVFNGVSNGALTVTGGGITADESATINAPVTIGAPQAWTIASGKSLVIGGNLHTIISPLSLNGDGDTTVTGSIDGGGALNATGVAPGAITKTGAGTLRLSGPATYSVPLALSSGYISFEQTGSNVANYTGVISGGGSGWISKSNSGTIILSAVNSYNCWTRIYDGVIQADLNVGLPSQSSLILNGGVFQSNSTATYGDKFRNEVAGTNRWLSWWDGGFAGGGGKLTVNLRGDGSAVQWTGNGDTGLYGLMKLNSNTAQNEVELKNALNLNGAERTVFVDDNPNSTADFASISGVISNGSGTSRLTKTGSGRLVLTGANSYGDGRGYDEGSTKINDGVLQADRGVGLSPNSSLILNGGVLQSNSAVTFSDGLYWGTGETAYSFTWASGGFSAGGGKMTVNVTGSITTLNFGDVDGRAGIAGIMKLSSNSAQYETEIQNPVNLNGGARTIQVDDNPNSNGDFASLSGVVADSVGGGSFTKTGKGTLYLKGAAANTYTGVTTVAGGTLVLAKTGVTALAGNILMSEPGDGTSSVLQLNGNNQIAPSSVMTFNAPVGGSRLELNGHSQTLAGISGDSHAVIEGLLDNTGLNSDSTLMVSNVADCTFQGVIRNSLQGSGTGKVNLVKNAAGSLLLTNVSTYSGATTINSGTLQITGSILPSSGVLVRSGATLYFNRADGYLGYTGPITGTGTVQIFQGAHSFNAGTGGNTTLTSYAGLVSLMSGAVYLRSADGLGSGGVNVGNGVVFDLLTAATVTLSNPITLNGLGGTVDGYAKPAIYGDGGSNAYTLSGPITLAATSDVGNYKNNGMLTFSGQITGPGGLVIGKAAPTLADQYGPITLSGATSNDYAGSTTINRGTVYLQKTAGAVAIPGNVTLSTAVTAPTGNTFLILKASNQLAPTAVMTFTPGRSYYSYFELLGNDQTLGGISDATGRGVIENAEMETGITSLGTLTINNTADCTYSGQIRNGDLAPNGASTGLLALVKSGPGKLTLNGWYCSNFTGGLTVNAGTLDYSAAGSLPGMPVGPTGPTSPAVITPCPYTINGGVLNIGGLSASIGAFQMTGGTIIGTGTLTSNAAYDLRGGVINANLAGTSIGLAKSGATATTLTGANSYTGRTTVTGGLLELGPAAQSTVFTLGGVDLQSGRMLFDYTGSASPAATVRSLLTASSHGGQWDVGQFMDTTAATSGLTLGWADDCSTAVAVMATYPGDFNLDGMVNGADLDLWFANAGKGTKWSQGDANYDGRINGLDFDQWMSHVGLPPLAVTPPGSGEPVPEPGTLVLVAAGLIGLLAHGRKRRT
jgi:fibronectin-binding autotransporter adhesin